MTVIETEDAGGISENEKEFFGESDVRMAWHKQEEEWYFSVVDVCAILTEQESARNASTYWAVLKKRLKEEGADELLTNCKQLKMPATDGKMRKTDCANVGQLFRIIQSIPSKRAEPFKEWLALVGKERLDEIADPEKAMERAVATYKAKGYSDKWISQRLRSIEIREKLPVMPEKNWRRSWEGRLLQARMLQLRICWMIAEIRTDVDNYHYLFPTK